MSSQEDTHDDPKEKPYDEATLVMRFQEDDTDALAGVLTSYGANVKAVLRARFFPALTDEDVEEVIAKGLFTLWQARSRVDLEKGTLGGWFYVICRNTAINMLKEKKVREGKFRQFLEERVAPDSTQIPSEESGARQFLVRKIISELKPVDQAIVCAFVNSYGDKSWTTGLADQLGMTRNHIRVRWSRIKRLIEKRMTQKGLSTTEGHANE